MKPVRLLDGVDAAPTRGGDGSLVKAVLLVILACLAALLVAGCAAIGASETSQEEAAAAKAAAEQPNILFVLTDDLDLTSVEKMPNINSLIVGEGATFEIPS